MHIHFQISLQVLINTQVNIKSSVGIMHFIYSEIN